MELESAFISQGSGVRIGQSNSSRPKKSDAIKVELRQLTKDNMIIFK